MSKIDNKLQRMTYLMGYKMGGNVNENKRSSNIEFVAEGADGKMYGIIKEGTHYYLKSCNKGGENLAENYEYVHGFNRRTLDESKSYDKASKKLELHLMSLNEAFNGNKNTSTFDFKRGEKTLSFLTEEARKAMDRANAIFENSQNIGKNNTGTPEAPANASDPTKQGEPFEEPVKATLDKDPGFKGTVEGALPEGSTVKDAEKNLTSDKNQTGGTEQKNYDKVSDSDVASDGKSVAVKEGLEEYFDDYDMGGEYSDDFEDMLDKEFGGVENIEPDSAAEEAAKSDEDFTIDNSDIEPAYPEDLGLEGEPEEEELVDDEVAGLEESKDEIIAGDDETLTGPHGKNSESPITVDRLSEAIEEICREIMNEKRINTNKYCDADECNDSFPKKEKFNPKKHLDEAKIKSMINKMVMEEITNLNVWGKHPRYGQQPFTLPDNTEVMKGSAEKDWNDDSAKGSERYGKKIGDGKPFDQKVSMLTDQVMKTIKESLKKKR